MAPQSEGPPLDIKPLETGLSIRNQVYTAFHQAVIRLSGSDLIFGLTENLILHVRAIRKATISHGDRAQRSLSDHLNIIEALSRRDAEAAETLSRQHALGLAAHVEKFCTFLD